MEERRLIKKLKFTKKHIKEKEDIQIAKGIIQGLINNIEESYEKENPEINIHFDVEVNADAEEIGKALKRYLRQEEVIWWRFI